MKKILFITIGLIIFNIYSASGENIKTDKNNSVIIENTLPTEFENNIIYEDKIPDTLKYQKKYNEEMPQLLNYVFVKSQKINLRERATVKSQIVSNAYYFEKLKLIEELFNDQGEKWYRVLDRKGNLAYVFSGIVEKRLFRFDTMTERLDMMDQFINKERAKGNEIASINAYIPDPNNKRINQRKDKYGNVGDQSTKGYYSNEYIYIPDRSILSITGKNGGMTEVKLPNIKEFPLKVNSSYITKSPSIKKSPDKAIVIDIKNQNFGVFERLDNEWTLISYSYSKTGVKSRLGLITPKGFFIAPDARKAMLYKNSAGELAGYANNAIRFSGGGYIHGTPFNYGEDERIKGPIKEASLGTYPGSRKCVRNTLSHSKFLFDWVLEGEISDTNYQTIKQNVAVIVI